ncbi:seryl-tRNA synthetase [Meira miltonrushii]|uniref:serine--tRNA ligase n=1 Tax=Meira miltonrushii TaxID=1280837 RepID=A0A316VMP6_9BASI|nr:seryl-tRNA synthetase [Meira miltonrushii]PWN37673.1 seryl-tRNA synthetase [Meira miltonrushii]
MVKEVENITDPDEKKQKEEILNQRKSKANELKIQLKEVQNRVDTINQESQYIRLKMPNLTHPYAPIGSILKANLIGFGGNLDLIPGPMRNTLQQSDVIGQKLEDISELEQGQPNPNRDHLTIVQQCGWVDSPASHTVAGPNWPYLLGPLAALEHALVNYAMDVAIRNGFTPAVVPDVVRRDILGRAGFSPRESEAGQVYWVQQDGDSRRESNREDANDWDLALAGTAEIALGGMFAGTAHEGSNLPLQVVASSHAFRAEAGARGQDSRGLYRVHQFTKVEMFVVCKQSESEPWLEKLRDTQEDIIQGLGLPYRVLDMPTEELGASAYRKYDIEAWMPGRGSWGEVSSASNCTEYQSRRLLIRYRPEKSDLFESSEAEAESVSGIPGYALPQSNDQTRLDAGEGLRWAHTLNATAVAVPRIIVALVENYGLSSSGDKLRLPVTLKKYWILSDVDSIEWFGQEVVEEIGTGAKRITDSNGKVKKASLFRRSLDSVRQAAKRSGTDPASMVVSFMILHELTAILPLIAIFYILCALGTGASVMQWLLDASDKQSGQESGMMTGMRASLRDYIQEGMQRAERYGRKKGWFGFEKGSQVQDVEVDAQIKASPNAEAIAGTFANAVAAYAITKALLPVRLAACVGFAGPFARWTIEPIKRIIRRNGKSV